MSAAVELVAGAFRVVPSRSTVRFAVPNLFGLARVTGTVPVTAGSVAVDGGVARISAVLDATGLMTGNTRRDKDLRSKRFLDTDRFPRWEFTGDYSGEGITGALTAHGQTAPCELHVRSVERTGDRIDVVATGRIDRRAHGVTAGRGLIGTVVEVELAVCLLREDA